MFVILDLETSGLDPQSHDILEVACIVLHDLESLAERSSFQAVVGRGQAYAIPDQFVREMHSRNGLLQAVRTGGHTLEAIDAYLEQELRQLGAEERGVYLVGDSVHFDLGFIRAQMSKTARLLSHRIVDCTTLRTALQAWGLGDAKKDVGAGEHRAMADCRSSLGRLRLMRNMVQR